MNHTLFNLCLQFKTRICQDIGEMSNIARSALKGDYLFIIDGHPLFIMLVDDCGAWSILLKPKRSNHASDTFDSNAFDIEFDEECPFVLKKQQVIDIIESSSRCQIKTDSKTLQRILIGTLKARVAFITQRVKITGDFPAFLKIISYLKTKGRQPNASQTS